MAMGGLEWGHGGAGNPSTPGGKDGLQSFRLWEEEGSPGTILHCLPGLDEVFGEGIWKLGGFVLPLTLHLLSSWWSCFWPPAELSGGVLWGGWAVILRKRRGCCSHSGGCAGGLRGKLSLADLLGVGGNSALVWRFPGETLLLLRSGSA